MWDMRQDGCGGIYICGVMYTCGGNVIGAIVCCNFLCWRNRTAGMVGFTSAFAESIAVPFSCNDVLVTCEEGPWCCVVMCHVVAITWCCQLGLALYRLERGCDALVWSCGSRSYHEQEGISLVCVV